MAIRPCRSISSSCEVEAHSRTRFRSLLPVAARSSMASICSSNCVRGPQRQASVLVLASGSRRARRGRGTSTAGSPFPCRRASARTCRRTVPLVIAPTMLPAVPRTRLFGFLPFTPLCATLRPTPPLVNHSGTNTTRNRDASAPGPVGRSRSGRSPDRRPVAGPPEPKGRWDRSGAMATLAPARRRRRHAEEVGRASGGRLGRDATAARRSTASQRPARPVPTGADARRRGRRPRPPRRPAPAAAAARSAGRSASSSTRGAGSQRSTQALWNQAPCRLRRWARPTTLRPSAVTTSPAPTPPKQTSDDQRVQAT